MGVVFDALSPNNERVALKVIRPMGDGEHARSMAARFEREAKILKQLSHPNIVRLVDAGDHEGVLYLAMELIEGVSLLTIRRKGSLGFEALAQLGIQVADALHHMHEAGVIHRDIKPANVLIDARGQPVITDFGISGMSEATGITKRGDLLGSPGFMSPEVIDGFPPTAQSDQFALGRLLFELGAQGAPPKLPKNAPIFEILAMSLKIDWIRFPSGDTWMQLQQVLARMLANDPKDRYPTCEHARKALSQLLAHDLLDTDTLSEHLEQLQLQPSTGWEFENVDAKPSPSVPGDPFDELLLNINLPAGERSQAELPSFPERDPQAERRNEAAEAAALVETVQDNSEVPLSFALEVPLMDEEPTQIPPPDFDDTPGPSGYGAGARTGSSGRKNRGRVMLPAESIPTRQAAPASSDASPLPPDALAALAEPGAITGPSLELSPPSSEMEPRPLSAMLASSSKVPLAPPEDPANVAPDSSGQIQRLERRLTRLREELQQSQRRAQSIKKRRPLWVLAIAFALVAGALGGVYWARMPKEAPVLVLVPPRADLPVEASHKYTRKKPPTVNDTRDAQEMLKAAQEHLQKRDLDAAERVLGLCIEIADLPGCHKAMGSLLALTQNPAAVTYFEHYLNVAPAAPDAGKIREALDAL